MILSLAMKLFLLNSKRTIKAAQLLTISLIAITATNMFIATFNVEIGNLSLLLDYEEDYLIAQPSDGVFTHEQATMLTQIGEQIEGVLGTQFMFNTFSPINISGNLVDANLYFVNFTSFFNSQYQPGDFWLTSDLVSQFGDNAILNIEWGDISENLFNLKEIQNDQRKINSGIYLSSQLFEINEFNLAYFDLSDAQSYSQVENDLQDKEFVEVISITDEESFLLASTRSFSRTMTILVSLISIIVFFSITNIISVMIKESRNEIRNLKSIGYSTGQIRTLFMVVGGIIGIVSAIFTLLFSLAITNIVILVISIFSSFNYIVVILTASNLLIIVSASISVSLLSTIYPLMREVL